MNGSFFKQEWVRYLIQISGACMLTAGLMRLMSIVPNSQILLLPDPILQIPLRRAALIVAVTELSVATVCLFGKKTGWQAGLIVWLCGNFFVYRGILFFMHCRPRLSAWGMVENPLRLPLSTLDHIIMFAMAGLFIGGVAALFALRIMPEPSPSLIQQRSFKPQDELKIACERCGGKIAFTANRMGQKIICPHCKEPILLRSPRLLKSECRECGGHIEFPPYAIGQTIACPHCAAPLVLREREIPKAILPTNGRE